MSTYVVTLVIEDVGPDMGSPEYWPWAEMLDYPGAVMNAITEEIESHPTPEQIDLFQRLTSDYRRAIKQEMSPAPEEEDEDSEVISTWEISYSTKPEWWDDDSEPRCDVCGMHCEEVEWCGECGNCVLHCEGREEVKA